MSEELSEDDFEFDSEDIFEEPDDRSYEDVRREEVSTLVAEWERENGIELSAEEFDQMGVQVAVGVAPDEAYSAATDAGRFETSYQATLAAVERERGYKLLDREREAIWEAAVQASEDPRVETDAAVWGEARKATSDLLATSDGVAAYIGERLAVPAERQEPSARTEDGAESYNLDNREEREAAIDAALAGETVATHDNDDLAEDA